MNSKMVTKVVATFLAFLLSFANVALLGGYVNKTYAAETNLEKQQTRVNKAELEFDAYFQEEGKKTHSKAIDVQNGDKLYLSFKIADGYLANGQVSIENANFKMQNLKIPSEKIQSISSDENKIVLNQINRDESAILEIPIKINADSSFNVEDINKVALVKFSGTYINGNGKEIEVNNTIELKTILAGNAQSYLNGEVTKYVTFNVNGNKGVILQTLFTSNLINNTMPVKSTKLEIEIPVINNINPKVITLSAKSLMATKGEGARVFTESDYKTQNGKVILNIENNEEIVSWVKDATDQILLTCIYDEAAIVENAQVKFNAKSEITCYEQNLTKVNTEINGALELKEQIGDIVTLDNKTSVDNLYKGYMLEKNGKGTSFVNTIALNIGYSELIDSIVFNDKVSYVDNNGNLYPSDTLYTYLKVSKENIVEILGEDGYINVYNKTGEKISTLNKDNTEYKFENGVSGINFETSKPVREGILEIENGREIASLEYSKSQMDMFEDLKVTLNANVKKDNTVIINGNLEKNIKLEKPASQAVLELDNSNFSTVVKNEGVELRVTLKTMDESTKLYKNPEITIEFPSYITNVDVENVKLVYEKELKITSAQMYKNNNGNIIISIKLDGEQTSHNENGVIEGATLVMKADITVNKLTPTGSHNANLKVKNANGNEEINEQTVLNFVAPAGIATISQITGYSEVQDGAVSISGQMGIGELETGKEAKRANVKVIAINNYTYDCDNVVILGRTPSEGNKSIGAKKDLGSTFSAKMVSEIKSANGLGEDDMTVYYSANNSANTKLDDKSNGWTNNKNEIENVASYMIVLNEDYKVPTGEIMSFDYDIEIPENLKNNEATYATFGVYYEEAKEEETLAFNLDRTMSIEATPVALSTPTVADLGVVLTSNVGNKANTPENSRVEYTATVTNKENAAVDGVYLIVHVPSNAGFVDSSTGKIETGDVHIPIGRIEPGEDKAVKVNFALRMGDFVKGLGYTTTGIVEKDEDGNILESEAGVTGSLNVNNGVSVTVSAGIEGQTEKTVSNSIENTIVQGVSGINMNLTTNNDGHIYADGKTEIGYSLTLSKSNAPATLNDVEVQFKVPEGVKVVSTSPEYTSYSNGMITWNMGTLANTNKYLSVKLVAEPFEKEDIYQKPIDIKFTSTCKEAADTIFESNIITTQAYVDSFEISQKHTMGTDVVSQGDKITYVITATNKSAYDSNFTITDILPNELENVKYSYERNGKTETGTKLSGTNRIDINVTLNAGETLQIYVSGTAMEIKNTKRTITNKVSLNSTKIKDLKAEDVILTLLGNGEYDNGNEPVDPDNPETPDKDKHYNISGIAWLDENKDGKRDNNEKLLSGILVYLLDSTTKQVVHSTETNLSGAYIFRNVPNGSYVVAFGYDTEEYSMTTYKADNVDESINSDAAINIDLTLDSKSGKYAVTNTIIPTANVYNIDLGLVDNPKFDLELKKGVTLMQVSNSSGVKSYTFDNTDSAQVQIPEKYMNGTVVAITYKIAVTNTGDVSGFANKIVDYKAKDLTFNSGLNPEWYEDTDGNLYTTSLAGREIKPGETVELSLVLTKTMNNNNIGISNNTAEIYEASNDLGLKDIDSTPGNRNSSEDDYGIADVFITLKTGGILFYGGIVLAVLAIFALGAYEINKRVLRKI